MINLFKKSQTTVILSLAFFCLVIILLGLLIQQGYLPKSESSADLLLTEGRINVKFNITNQDKALAEQFFKNLGDEQLFQKGISLELDKNSLNQLSASLPTSVKLYFDSDSDELSFKSSRFNLLTTSLVRHQYQYASSSASINLQVFSNQDYSLEISNPETLLKEATSSGQINLSKKAESLFPILEKIAKIELRVNGKNINGEIKLKN